jgi:hypothetical protein
MNIPPIIIKIKSVLVIIAMIHKFAPNERLHTSHMKNFAGFTLNHRNAISAPKILKHRVERRNSSC